MPKCLSELTFTFELLFHLFAKKTFFFCNKQNYWETRSFCDQYIDVICMEKYTLFYVIQILFIGFISTCFLFNLISTLVVHLQTATWSQIGRCSNDDDVVVVGGGGSDVVALVFIQLKYKSSLPDLDKLILWEREREVELVRG